MDYGVKLESLLSLKSMSSAFNFLSKNLSQVYDEKYEIEHDIFMEKNNILKKIFNRDVYKTKLNNLNFSLKRVNEVISIFEANPNKDSQVDITLRDILNSAIERVSSFLPKEKVEKIQSSSYGLGANIDSMSLYPDLDVIFDIDTNKKEEIKQVKNEMEMSM